MGLNLHIKNYNSENSKIGSYTGFNNFREKWAEHLGFNLREMDGFDGDKEWTNEPLQCFFYHSDCDGELSVKECKEILPIAKKSYEEMSGDGQGGYSFPILIEFCEQAIKENKKVEFC